VIDDLSTGRKENIAHLVDHPMFTFRCARLENEAVIEELAEGAEVILHLAAAVGVRLVVQEPARSVENNLTGSRSVLRCARRHGNRVLITSSSEVYGKGTTVPFHEDQDVVLGPSTINRWSYAAGKLAEEFLSLAYHRQHRVPVVVARLFNTVGPRQTGRFGMVVPRFVRQALAAEPITVYGDGAQTRSFCDVRDVVECLVGLMDHAEATGTVFNVGKREEISILDLASRIKELSGSGSEIVEVPYEEAYGTGFEDLRRRSPDTSRVEGMLGWRPRRSLDETLLAVIDYERDRAGAEKATPSQPPSVWVDRERAGPKGSPS
jgi:UDP-glucose 4-epimerase